MNTRNSKCKVEIITRLDIDTKPTETRGGNKVLERDATGVLDDENGKLKSKRSTRPSRSRKKKSVQSKNSVLDSKAQEVDESKKEMSDEYEESRKYQVEEKGINKENEEKSKQNSSSSKSRASVSLSRDLANLCVQDSTKTSPKAVASPVQKQKDVKKFSTSPNLNKKPLVTQKRRARRPKIDSTNHKITEYYQVRKSDRKCKTSLEYEKMRDFELKIVNRVQDGLEIKDFGDKGRGIVTTREFHKGEFVVEYIGDLIDRSAAREREAKYAKNKKIGCYMYYFKHRDSQYCIDATEESDRYGRLINHSRKGNLISRVFDIGQEPHLVLLARTDIPAGTEILYDYGERDPEIVQNHPWLNL